MSKNSYSKELIDEINHKYGKYIVHIVFCEECKKFVEPTKSISDNKKFNCKSCGNFLGFTISNAYDCQILFKYDTQTKKEDISYRIKKILIPLRQQIIEKRQNPI